jgi:hypothetical protein
LLPADDDGELDALDVPELDSLDEPDVDVALEEGAVDDDAAPDEGDEVPDDELDPLVEPPPPPALAATPASQLSTHVISVLVRYGPPRGICDWPPGGMDSVTFNKMKLCDGSVVLISICVESSIDG